MNRLFWLLALGLAACLSACNSTSSAQTETHNSGSQDLYGICDPGTFDFEHNRMTDSMAFPYVHQGQDNTLYLAAYEVQFALVYEDPLYPITNADIPWIDPEAYSEINGNYVTFVRNGRELSLQNPYIMVQYIQKSNELTKSPDVVYDWLDSAMLTNPGSKKGEFYSLATRAGKDALCREYTVAEFIHPENPYLNKIGKSVAYAYIDFDDEYMIGMTLTCSIESDFQLTLPLFQRLVKSMCF